MTTPDLRKALDANDPPHPEALTWTCEITGPGGALPDGADLPMRQAVREAYHRVTGNDETRLSSGWGILAARTPAPDLQAALATALAVALHEAADPECRGQPEYTVTQAQAESIADAVMRMPILLAALDAARTPAPHLRAALEVISEGRHPDGHRGAVMVARAALGNATPEHGGDAKDLHAPAEAIEAEWYNGNIGARTRDRLLAALGNVTAEPTLDAVWKAAEAALPEGADLWVGRLDSGYVAEAERIHHRQGDSGEWVGGFSYEKRGSSPAEALMALAARLSAPTDGGD